MDTIDILEVSTTGNDVIEQLRELLGFEHFSSVFPLLHILVDEVPWMGVEFPQEVRGSEAVLPLKRGVVLKVHQVGVLQKRSIFGLLKVGQKLFP